MKRYLVLSFIIAVVGLSCNSQNELTKDDLKSEKLTLNNEPKGSWKVNKEFDEFGNLIRFDSIYTYSSTKNFESLSSQEQDSLFKSFYFKNFKNFDQFDNDDFFEFFLRDSLLNHRLLFDSYFKNEFGAEVIDFSDLIEDMESRHQKIFEKIDRRFSKQPLLKKED